MLCLATGFWDTPFSTELGHCGPASHPVAPSPGARISILPACGKSPPQAFGPLTVAGVGVVLQGTGGLAQKTSMSRAGRRLGVGSPKRKRTWLGDTWPEHDHCGNDELHGNFLPYSWRGCRGPCGLPRNWDQSPGLTPPLLSLLMGSLLLALRSQQPGAGPSPPGWPAPCRLRVRLTSLLGRPHVMWAFSSVIR